MGTLPKPRVQGSVLTYVHNHPGKSIRIEDLVKATGFTATQVQAVMLRLSHDPARRITVIQRGSLWRYDPEPEAVTEPQDVNGNIYEAVGRSATGAIIVRDNDDVLYVLKPIKI